MVAEIGACVRDHFEYHARVRPAVQFSRFHDRVISYHEADQRANQIANALAAAGCGKGVRFAVLSENCDHVPLIFLAGAKGGAITVPLNFRLAPREWRAILEDAGVALIIVRGKRYVEAVDSLRAEVPALQQLIAIDSDLPDGWVGWKDWLAEEATTPPAVEMAGGDVIYQMYTSGTTGLPKGAMLTNANAVANLQQMIAAMPYRMSPGQRSYVMLPMFHASGGFGSIVAVMSGATLVISDSADPTEIVRALDEDDINATILVPALIQACTLVPGVEKRMFRSLKFIGYGGSPIAEDTLRRALQIFRCDFVQGYGLTETVAGVSCLNEQDHRQALDHRPELLRSAGRPFISTQVKVVDPAGDELSPGSVGELLVRGPQVMAGYWMRDDRGVQTDGWFRTGDAARIDADGYIYIEDRIKDMIVSGGENVYPREVENVLFEHPEIADASVIGIPDDRWGEAVLAVCVRRPDSSVSAETLVDFCREHLAGYKSPRQIEFVDALPRNPSGKVLKNELRAPYWAHRNRQVN